MPATLKNSNKITTSKDTKISKNNTTANTIIVNQKLKSGTELQHRVALAELDILTQFVPFYKSLNDKDAELLFAYKGTAYFAINKYLFSDTVYADFTGILFSLDLHKIVFNKDALFQEQYTHLAKYIPTQFRVETLRQYIQDHINNTLIHSINSLTQLFDNPHIPHLGSGMTLYKGLNTCFIKQFKTGDDVIFKNFISTTLNYNTAVEFASNYEEQRTNTKTKRCICVMTGFNNTKYIYIPETLYTGDLFANNAYKSESELLLCRNTKFTITQIATKSYKLPAQHAGIKFSDLHTFTQQKKKTIKHILKSYPIHIYHLKYIEQLPCDTVPPWKMPLHYQLPIILDGDGMNNNIHK
jgi:hypothetical protein